MKYTVTGGFNAISEMKAWQEDKRKAICLMFSMFTDIQMKTAVYIFSKIVGRY